MKAQDARLILSAHRSDGRYRTNNPLFAEALAEAARDPELGAWLAHEQALDTAIAAKLDGIQPPAGLRDAILVGARASRLTRRWWRNPAWFAAAASLTVLLVITSVFLRSNGPGVPAASLAEFGLDQLAFSSHAHNKSEGAVALEAMLTKTTEPLCECLDMDAAELARRGCEEFTFGGRRVYEVCFRRNGTWFHLYVSTHDVGNPHDAGPEPSIVERNGLVAATWSNGGTVFALATKAGADVLKSVL